VLVTTPPNVTPAALSASGCECASIRAVTLASACPSHAAITDSGTPAARPNANAALASSPTRNTAATAVTYPDSLIQATNEAHTAPMRSVSLNPTGQPVLAASAALLVTLVSCSSNRGSSDVTAVVFDGQSYSINGPVTCTTQPDGKLLIYASPPAEEGAKKMVRVLLRQKHRLVVEKAGLRFLDVRGFTDDSSEIYATKVDNTYRISGRMPPNIGETAWHQFEIEATCP
jgi:hypothetical protein